MEISQWKVPEFFSKLAFHMNKKFKTWGKSLQLPYANEAKFWSTSIQYGLSSSKQPPTPVGLTLTWSLMGDSTVTPKLFL